MAKSPLISVIIPCWNSRSTIGLTLDALERQTLDRDLYEVIVVDNGSTDGSDELVARRNDVRLLKEPRPGSYAARNLGLSQASGQFVAFTDSDCIPDAAWLERCLEAIRQRSDVGVVAGPVKFFETASSNHICFLYESLFAMRQDSTNGQVATANWMCRKALIDAFGGFRDDLKSGGDHELSGRMHAAGYESILAEHAIVRHPARGEFSELVKKTRRVVGGKWQSRLGDLQTVKRLRAESLNAWRRTRIVIRANDLGIFDKISLVALIGVLWTVSAGELLRLRLGGQPRRS